MANILESGFSVSKYDPSKVSVSVGAEILKGFGVDSMVEVEFAEDHYSMHIGVDGSGRHVKSLNRSGTVTITLADYSPSNLTLSIIRDVDKAMPITITDKSSKGDFFAAASCLLVKTPNLVKGKEPTDNVYVFQFISGRVYHTGGKPNDLLGAFA